MVKNGASGRNKSKTQPHYFPSNCLRHRRQILSGKGNNSDIRPVFTQNPSLRIICACIVNNIPVFKTQNWAPISIQASLNLLPAAEVKLFLETSTQPGNLLLTPLICHQSTPYSQTAHAKTVSPHFIPHSASEGHPQHTWHKGWWHPLPSTVPRAAGSAPRSGVGTGQVSSPSPGAKRRNGCGYCCRWSVRAQPPSIPCSGPINCLNVDHLEQLTKHKPWLVISQLL